ncbi:hypothetical protein E5288_WYG021505 [Bos mutus]|uniref:Uncharacterized protein n=1 Tax=Bos mutus TaxID=72004 RepID=A0A6B0R452_9CETA|nr:hypothetical protein [Bos mutus]
MGTGIVKATEGRRTRRPTLALWAVQSQKNKKIPTPSPRKPKPLLAEGDINQNNFYNSSKGQLTSPDFQTLLKDLLLNPSVPQRHTGYTPGHLLWQPKRGGLQKDLDVKPAADGQGVAAAMKQGTARESRPPMHGTTIKENAWVILSSIWDRIRKNKYRPDLQRDRHPALLEVCDREDKVDLPH